jgi:hypothetical protein
MILVAQNHKTKKETRARNTEKTFSTSYRKPSQTKEKRPRAGKTKALFPFF